MTTLTAPGDTAREQALRALDRLPVFSPVLQQLRASLSSEDTRYAALAALIERDAALAGSVLGVVNSAAYGRRGRVSSVTHAISVLGLPKLRNLVLGLSVSRLWSRAVTPIGWSTARFNRHSVGVALLSDLLMQAALRQGVPLPFPEGAFTAGLLQNLGRLLLAMSFPEHHEALEAAALEGRLSEAELDLVGVTHGELSASALAKWNFPQPICDAVVGSGGGARGLALGDVVQAAERAVEGYGLRIERNRDDGETPFVVQLTILRLDLPELEAQFRVELDAMQSCLG